LGDRGLSKGRGEKKRDAEYCHFIKNVGVFKQDKNHGPRRGNRISHGRRDKDIDSTLGRKNVKKKKLRGLRKEVGK